MIEDSKNLKEMMPRHKYRYGKIILRPKETANLTESQCNKCFFYEGKFSKSQCKHLKDCIAFKRPDNTSVYFKKEEF